MTFKEFSQLQALFLLILAFALQILFTLLLYKDLTIEHFFTLKLSSLYLRDINIWYSFYPHWAFPSAQPSILIFLLEWLFYKYIKLFNFTFTFNYNHNCKPLLVLSYLFFLKTVFVYKLMRKRFWLYSSW